MPRPLLAVFLVLILLFSTAALAVDPPPVGDDAVLCIYTQWSEDSGPADGDIEYPAWVPFTAYPISIVLYHPEGEDGLAGLDYSLHVDQGEVELMNGVDFLFIDTVTMPGFEGDYINLGDPLNVFMGLSEGAFPVNGGIPIMTGQLFFLPTVALDEPITLRFGEFSTPSVPGQMTYVTFDDLEVYRRMVPNNMTGDLALPVFSFGVPVSVQGISLSGVKSLFN